ncbi:MAG: M28 family peptidase, partial [Chloroflexi bacterium]
SSNFLMRYSGFDGPPGDLNPQDGNLPQQVNGWQEFYQYWGQQMVSPSVTGAFAPFVREDHHLFWSLGQGATPYQSDAATVTIPGSTCPGQVALVAGHPDSTPGLNTGNGSTYDDTSGVVMGIGELSALTKWWTLTNSWPTRTIKVGLFDAEETGLNGSAFYASNLIPAGPQGKYILVANMDQNGLEYPAFPAGTTQTTFGPHPWYTNINASPLTDFSIYGASGKANIEANITAVTHFRQALAQEVGNAFAALGAKYNFSLPLENPIEGGKTVPAYRTADIAAFSPVQDDTLGRTDQVPFIALGIPGFGVVGAYDSNNQDNPTATMPGPLTPLGASGIPQIAGYDTPRDNIVHYNLMTSGTTGGGPGGVGSVAVKRAIELPMTWTTNLLARPEYVGHSARPQGPVAYFESLPTAPKPGDTVSFNAGSAADVARTGGLSYTWDFGDGSKGTGVTPTHAYTAPGWHDAKLVVTDGAGRHAGYRAAVKVGSPSGSAPNADACGVLTAKEVAAVITPAPNVPEAPVPVLLLGLGALVPAVRRLHRARGLRRH